MATCNPATLIDQAKCFQSLSKKELQVVIAQLLCNINASGGGSGAPRAVFEGVAATPTLAGFDPPPDPTHGAIYYQDPSITLYNQWTWSVSQQKWYQWSSPA